MKHTAVIVVAVVATVAAALLDLRVPGEHRRLLDLEAGWLAGFPGVALAVPGALLLKRIPTHPVAWILAVTGLHWSLDGLASSWLAYATLAEPALPGAEFAFWAYQRLGASLLLALPLVLLFYPDGRLPAQRRWRTTALASLAATSLFPLMLLVVPSDLAQEQQTGEALPAPLATLNLDLTTVPLPAGFWQPAFAISLALVPLSPARAVRGGRPPVPGRDRRRAHPDAVAALGGRGRRTGDALDAGPAGRVHLARAHGRRVRHRDRRRDRDRPARRRNVDELLGGTLRYGTLAIAGPWCARSCRCWRWSQ